MQRSAAVLSMCKMWKEHDLWLPRLSAPMTMLSDYAGTDNFYSFYSFSLYALLCNYCNALCSLNPIFVEHKISWSPSLISVRQK